MADQSLQERLREFLAKAYDCPDSVVEEAADALDAAEAEIRKLRGRQPVKCPECRLLLTDGDLESRTCSTCGAGAIDLLAYDKALDARDVQLARLTAERAADALDAAEAQVGDALSQVEFTNREWAKDREEIARLTAERDAAVSKLGQMQVALNLANTERVRCVSAAWNEAIEAAAKVAYAARRRSGGVDMPVSYRSYIGDAIRQLKREDTP